MLRTVIVGALLVGLCAPTTCAQCLKQARLVVPAGCWVNGVPQTGRMRPVQVTASAPTPGSQWGVTAFLYNTAVTSPPTTVVFLFGMPAAPISAPSILEPTTGAPCTLNIAPFASVGLPAANPGPCSGSFWCADATLRIQIPGGACGAAVSIQAVAIEPAYNAAGLSVSGRLDVVVGL